MRADLIGLVFARLTVVEYLGKAPNGKNALWKCRCACGEFTTADTRQLKAGKKRDCGCMKGIRDDLTGKSFGDLTPIQPVGKSNDNQTLWRCRCDCGKPDCLGEITVEARRLKLGYALSCEYDPTGPRKTRVDYTGYRFGLLTVLEPTEKRSYSHNRIYRCRCQCGTILELPDNQLVSGNNKSCGCLRRKT